MSVIMAKNGKRVSVAKNRQGFYAAAGYRPVETAAEPVHAKTGGNGEPGIGAEGQGGDNTDKVAEGQDGGVDNVAEGQDGDENTVPEAAPPEAPPPPEGKPARGGRKKQ